MIHNPHLHIIESVGGWAVEHVPSGKLIERFHGRSGAERFEREIADLDWNFTNPLQTPARTWGGMKVALSRRGIELKADWRLADV